MNYNKNSILDRNSNFELLRIISMVLIVLNHYVVNDSTLIELSKLPLSINKIVLQSFTFGGLGVDLFILISGYFLINSKPTIEKTLKLVLNTTSYSIILAILGVVLSVTPLRTFPKYIFPIIYPVWWFINTYIVMYIFSDYINVTIRNISVRSLDKIITIMFIINSVIPTVFASEALTSNLLLFIMLYFIAARIRMYGFFYKRLSNFTLLHGVFIYLTTQLSTVAFNLLGLKWHIFSEHATYLRSKNSILIVISAVLIFYGFSRFQIGSRKIINVIASTTLGVYLIHMHPVLQRILWCNIFVNENFVATKIAIPHAIIVSLLVFSVCSLLSFLFDLSLGKLNTLLSKKISNLLKNIRFESFI